MSDQKRERLSRWTRQPAAPRQGSCLEHGSAHAKDHARWSRRDFLSSLGLVAAGGAITLGGTPVRTFGQSRLLSLLSQMETDRVLVLVQLSGGNDGLNNVVPITNDLYYNARPQIAIRAQDALPIPGNLDLGFHPAFADLSGRYADGQMAVLQNVGYPQPRLSHFDSTDVWLTGSDSADMASTGWVGRYLDNRYPNFDEDPTDHPLAVQMGGTSSLLFQGPSGGMGMAVASPDLFQRLAEEGVLYSLEGLPETVLGSEMAFVRTVANDSFFYAEAVQNASEAGRNDVEYPPAGPLADNLSIVARMIKGNLGAMIYHVSVGSFDTHANQGGVNGQHANLLRSLAQTVNVFLSDLEAAGMEQDVLVATFSEFGRRVGQNGSGGTDHGTAAPLFLLGAGVEGGIYGSLPNLADLDVTGNLKFDIDFRDVYATLLQDWFGLPAETVVELLEGEFETIDFVSEPAMPIRTEREGIPAGFALDSNYPNPFAGATTISYTLHRPGPVRLQVFDANGRLVRTLVDAVRPAGSNQATFDAGGLSAGTYLYRLETQSGSRTRSMVVLR